MQFALTLPLYIALCLSLCLTLQITFLLQLLLSSPLSFSGSFPLPLFTFKPQLRLPPGFLFFFLALLCRPLYCRITFHIRLERRLCNIRLERRALQRLLRYCDDFLTRNCLPLPLFAEPQASLRLLLLSSLSFALLQLSLREATKGSFVGKFLLKLQFLCSTNQRLRLASRVRCRRESIVHGRLLHHLGRDGARHLRLLPCSRRLCELLPQPLPLALLELLLLDLRRHRQLTCHRSPLRRLGGRLRRLCGGHKSP
mmetsp:Transcript_43557/g.105725  ORF Transcript_43557/g.105725 Transcript_43557/m.105725 type:complete len:255 (+) Transcript_43557:75-839(+)